MANKIQQNNKPKKRTEKGGRNEMKEKNVCVCVCLKIFSSKMNIFMLNSNDLKKINKCKTG